MTDDIHSIRGTFPPRMLCQNIPFKQLSQNNFRDGWFWGSQRPTSMLHPQGAAGHGPHPNRNQHQPRRRNVAHVTHRTYAGVRCSVAARMKGSSLASDKLSVVVRVDVDGEQIQIASNGRVTAVRLQGL